MGRAYGKRAPNKNGWKKVGKKGGKKGGKRYPPYLSSGETWMGKQGKDAWDLVLGRRSEIDTEDFEEEEETESEEGEMRKWATERAIRMFGPR